MGGGSSAWATAVLLTAVPASFVRRSESEQRDLDDLEESRQSLLRWCEEAPDRTSELLCSMELSKFGGQAPPHRPVTGAELSKDLKMHLLGVKEPVEHGAGTSDASLLISVGLSEELHSAVAKSHIFLLSAFSHDDETQGSSLLPHFMEHYINKLEVPPENFLLLLHSASRNITGLAHFCRHLQERYGVLHMFPAIYPYRTVLHLKMCHRILHLFVRPQDWVLQVDSDEFVHFPEELQVLPVVTAMDVLGHNAHFGILVDRVRLDGRVDVAPVADVPLAVQYPVTCALVWLLQQSDVRKAVLYRGYLRQHGGGHQIIGLNGTLAARVRGKGPRRQLGLFEALSRYLGKVEVALLPREKDGGLFWIKPVSYLATVFHFKWICGLEKKIARRFKTEQYRVLRRLGGRLSSEVMKHVCSRAVPPHPDRIVPARELLRFSTAIKEEQVDRLVELSADTMSSESYLWGLLASHMASQLPRDQCVPAV